MKNIDNLWALEYSAKQDCFNIDHLEDILLNNLSACYSKFSNDYQIILIGTEQECRNFCEQVKEKIY